MVNLASPELALDPLPAATHRPLFSRAEWLEGAAEYAQAEPL